MFEVVSEVDLIDVMGEATLDKDRRVCALARLDVSMARM
jgi:hypothetical protein